MTETTTPSSAEGDVPAAAAAPEAEGLAAALEPVELSIRSMLEAGVHFGHQTDRWNPLMRPFIFGARNGTHILDLDQTLPLFKSGLDYVREVTAQGGHVLFVGTKRQAAQCIEDEAKRAGQYFVNKRWLGGMMTNWKTVKKSIETYKSLLEILGDEERRVEFSKKELARMTRLCEKYAKSLEGIKDMPRLPSALFVIDVLNEGIAISEAKRLGIPVIGVVDTNCDPRNIDFVVPGNDDASRAIDLYCKCVADACIEGAAAHQDEILERERERPVSVEEKVAKVGGRRVVEITQPPRRGRGAAGPGAGAGGGGGRTQSAGGWSGKGKEESGEAPAQGSEEGQS